MDRFIRVGLTVVLIFIVCLGGIDRARASAIVIDGRPYAPAEDQIFVYYDPATRQETLILSPAIRYRGDSFAWTLPLSVEPKAYPVAPLFFQRIAAYTSPLVQIQTRFKWSFGFAIWEFLRPKAVEPLASPLDATEGKVVVARRTALAQGSVIAQPDEKRLAEAIKAALKKKPDQPYQLPAEFAQRAAPHIAQKTWWVVIAGKTDAIEKETGFDEQVALPPFALTFQTDKPILPITMPASENSPEGWPKHRNFKVYAVGRERLDIALGENSAFPATAMTFADRVSLDDWRERILSPGRPEIAVSAALFLTAFVYTERGGSPTPEAFEMRLSETRTTFRPPTEVIMKEERLIIPGEGVLIVLAGVAAFLRQRRRAATP